MSTTFNIAALALPTALIRSSSAPNAKRGTFPKSTLAQSRDFLLTLAELSGLKIPEIKYIFVPKSEAQAEKIETEMSKAVETADEKSEEEKEFPKNPNFRVSIVGLRPLNDNCERGTLHKTTKQSKEKSTVYSQLSTSVDLDLDSMTSTVHDLKLGICDYFSLPALYAQAMILICGEIILKNNSKPLSFYGVSQYSHIMVAIKEGTTVESDEKCEEMTDEHSDEMAFEPMAGVRENLGIAITSTMRVGGIAAMLQRRLERGNLPPTIKAAKPKILDQSKFLSELDVSLVDGYDPILLEKDIKCYKLPFCGHTMCGDSLLHYALSQLKSNETYVSCPFEIKDSICGQRIPINVIRTLLWHHFTTISDSDNNAAAQNVFELEMLAARNLIHTKSDVQRCGCCDTVLVRPLPKGKRTGPYSFKAVCSVCSHDKQKKIEFETALRLAKEKAEAVAQKLTAAHAKKPSFLSVLLPSLFGKKSITPTRNVKVDEIDQSMSEISVSLSQSQSVNLSLKANEVRNEEDKTTTSKDNSSEEEESKTTTEHVMCWGCSTEWKDVKLHHCGNTECATQFRASVIDVLATCPTKTVGEVDDVPLIRACQCGQLITHWEYCKHMQCKNCALNFCFVCLKPHIKGKGWQCGCSSDVCPVAPRQVDIPRGGHCAPSNLFPEFS